MLGSGVPPGAVTVSGVCRTCYQRYNADPRSSQREQFVFLMGPPRLAPLLLQSTGAFGRGAASKALRASRQSSAKKERRTVNVCCLTLRRRDDGAGLPTVSDFGFCSGMIPGWRRWGRTWTESPAADGRIEHARARVRIIFPDTVKQIAMSSVEFH